MKSFKKSSYKVILFLTTQSEQLINALLMQC